MLTSESVLGVVTVVLLPPLHPWKGPKCALAGKGQNKDALARAGNGGGEHGQAWRQRLHCALRVASLRVRGLGR